MKNTEDQNIQPPVIKKQKQFRFLKIIGRIILGILLLLFLIILFVRSPWGQSIIVTKAVSFLSDKTQTKVAVKNLFITFDGDIQLNGLYLEDTKGDTLIYSKSLEANVPLWALIKGNGIGVDGLEWEDLRANIIRKDTIKGFNFQFIIDAFASEETNKVEVDTTANPLNIILGHLHFKDFDIVYNDRVTGITSRYKIGTLVVDMDKTDLETMTFNASELELADSQITVYQTPVPQAPNTENTTLPLLAVDELAIDNVFTNYQSEADGLKLHAHINDFYAEVPTIDLRGQRFEIDECRLKNSSISLKTETKTNAVKANPSEGLQEDISVFEWPELQLVIKDIDLENNNFSYAVNNEKAVKGIFNTNAMALNDINFQANTIILKDKIAQFELEEATFKEISGINLKHLQFKIHASNKQLQVSNLGVVLNKNTLKGGFQLDYPTLSNLIKAPELSKVALNLPHFKIALQDLFLIQPDLKTNEYLNTLSENQITGTLKAQGYLSDINLSKMMINWSDTKILASGSIQNATNLEMLAFNIPDFSTSTTQSDIIKFIKEDSLNISLPKDAKLTGSATGNLKDMSAKAKLVTTQGLATLEGQFKNGETLAFNADFKIDDYKLNELLKNEQYGALNVQVIAEGHGDNINNLDAKLDATISGFKYNNYDINDLKLVGDIKKGKGTISSYYKDKNLNTTLDATVVLDSVAPEIKMQLNIIGADLQALGVVNRDIKTSMNIYADFKGNSTSFDFETTVNEGVFVYDNKSYLLGDLTAMAHIRSDTTSVSVHNKMLDLVLESNSSPQAWTNSIETHVQSYFYRDAELSDSIINNPVNLKLRGKISQSTILKEVFLTNIQDLDTIDVAIDYITSKRKLKASITAPHINYNNYKLDSLGFFMDTDLDKFNFNFRFNNIVAGPLNIQKTVISGNQERNELSLGFKTFHDKEIMAQASSKITGHREELRFHIQQDSLILNKTPWNIPEANEILVSDKKMIFNAFKFTKNNQSVEITDKMANISKNHIAVDFKNFKLSEFLNYLNPDNEIASGDLNGLFILEEPFGNTGIVADLGISKLQLLDVNLGSFTMNAKSLTNSSYDFNASMKGGEVDLDLKGDYIASESGAKLDLNLDINQFNMTALTGFSQGEITETDGGFIGNLKLSGTTADLKYSGQIAFNNADFKIARFNAAFTLQNETLHIDNSGLSMTNFTIRDENQNTFEMSGDIGTENFINPTFDFQVKASNFQVLNATKDDNDFLYGKARFDGTAKITGDLQVPKINMDMAVSSDTDITYVLPSATTNIEEHDGVVVFVNRNNPDAILTRSKENTATITGFDISALLKINKEAALTLILNEDTGDNFKVSGEGEFKMTMNPNGNLKLSGVYEVLSGHYELNLYQVVNRKFNLVPGSRVTWSGDPFDAKLDVKAVYKVKASASPLMAPVYSGSDPAIKGKFREVLPFLVYLNIDGQLMEPEIAFNLDMPEEDQAAIGGQVYGRINQLNNQEDELNRQVFSLLVLNRFYPDSGSDGSAGGVASIARDNLNDAVTSQLNTFSDKLLGNSGFELDFGLNSYTDYQGTSPQQRTQLDIAAQKKMFDDRLIVRVGSEVDIEGSNSTGKETPVIGNVSIEYLLTESGRYRVKGFNKNEFENVIDGETTVSGIALIFTQEFNQYNELWDALFKKETEKEKAEKAKKEAEEKAAIKKQKEADTNKSNKEKRE